MKKTASIDIEPTPKTAIEPGTLIAVVRQLRESMSACDSAAFALNVDLRLCGKEAQKEADEARAAVIRAGNRLLVALTHIEASPAFQAVRREMMSRAKVAVDDSE